jgi:hypothetical protein
MRIEKVSMGAAALSWELWVTRREREGRQIRKEKME